jgi:nucleotide-binding universal stress UspA family protein
MIRSILVPLDGSEAAERALPTALELATRHHAELRLATVHHLPPAAFVPEMPAAAFAEVDRAAREEAGRYLNAKLLELAGEQRVTTCEALLEGEPAGALAEYARGVDLIVMTTHGRGGLSRLWLGSVADRLVRLTDRPVLLIPAGETPPDPDALFDRVLVALDGSRRAEAALEAVTRWMPSDQGMLHLVQVIDPPFVFAPPPRTLPEHPESETIPHRTLVGFRYLRRLAQPTRRRDRAVGIHVPVGYDPAAEILAVAREHDVTLLAIATRGRGGLTRLMLGSTADKLVRGAERPVLVCHGAEGGEMLSDAYRQALEQPDPTETASAAG